MIQFIFLTLFSFSSWAQLTVNPIDFEQNPPDIEWQQINTEHFQLIFPSSIVTQAQKAAVLLEKAYPFVSRSLEVMPPKISLVLQNQSTMSNGFVTLAPRRSEWFITPATDPILGSTEWLKTLSIHEFRHVVQFQKIKQGFTKVFYIFLGEVGQALGLAFTLPPWALEGDAVGMETALTNSGRGRLPLFERDLRAILLSVKEYSYDKSKLRSYEDWVPNHYVWGYFLTSHLRNKYGDLALSKITDEASRNAFWPLSFYFTADSFVEDDFEDFYREAMKDLLVHWKEKLSKLSPTPYEVAPFGKRLGWTNYDYPQLRSQGSIIALKSGLSHIPRFVELESNSEKILFYPGPLVSDYPFKVRGDRLAFVELDFDPRWGVRDFTRLKVFDLNKKTFITDVPKTKWRLAILNHLGSKIAAASWSSDQSQSLDVISLSGKVLSSTSVPNSMVITSLDWLADDEVVIVTRNDDDSRHIYKLTLSTGQLDELFNAGSTSLGNVAVEDGHILFESPLSGIDNIYLLESKGPRQITSALFGAYAPEIHNSKLYYNDYTVDGMNVVTKSLPWDEEQSSSDSFYPVYEKFSLKEDKDSYSAQLSDFKVLPVEKYSQNQHAFNLHSWIIEAPPLSNTVTLVGYSRDILNKLSLIAGGIYDTNERVAKAIVGASWSHYYPVLDLQATYGSRRKDIRIGNQKIENKWEEGVIDLGLIIPWKKISGRFTQSFAARGFAKIIKVTNRLGGDSSDVNDGALFSPGADATISMVSRMASRDIVTPLGASVFAHIENGQDITGTHQKGFLGSLDSRLFLPGVRPHHAFYQQLAYERQRDLSYQYSGFIFYPRGTENVFLNEFFKYSANYTLPLFYPDWVMKLGYLERFYYLKRVYANVFYDNLQGRLRSINYQASSLGWELITENMFLRLMFPVNIGLRQSMVQDGLKRKNNFEVFITTNLSEF